MDNFESILNQAPVGIKMEDIRELMLKYNNNSVDVLSELWNVKEPVTSNIVIDVTNENRQRWHNVREICNAYEEEMQNFIHSKGNVM